MKKFLPLLAVLMVAVLLLSACGEPAYPAVSSHGEDDHGAAAEHDHADEEQHEEDEMHEEGTTGEDDDHAEDAEAEDHDEDAASGEEPVEEPTAEETVMEEPAAEDGDEEETDEQAATEADAEDTEADDQAPAAEEPAADESAAEEAPVEEAALVGDPANGAVLFNQMITEVSFACGTCHRVDSDLQLIGPGLLGIAARAAERDPEATPEEYVYTSIVNPDAYVVEGFSADLMPETYTEIFTPQEIADLVAYALSLEG